MPDPAVTALAQFPGETCPIVSVVIDTEEEFDWNAPFDRNSRGVGSIAEQVRAQEIFARHGVVPTYVLDHPVADEPAASELLRGWLEAGECQVGAHLHGWVTPPYDETVNLRNSYQCNLDPALERRKAEALTERITQAFGVAPKVFKAGRYGIGDTTIDIIADLGYELDCSVVPYTDFSAGHGPDFRGLPDQPYWTRRGILEVPLSKGFCGPLAEAAAGMQALFDAEWALRLRIPGILARLGLVQRATLTPEGVPLTDQIELADSLVRRGRKVFTITYHSPSLGLGHTPYVRTEAEREHFLAALDGMLGWFREKAGCRFVPIGELRNLASAPN